MATGALALASASPASAARCGEIPGAFSGEGVALSVSGGTTCKAMKRVYRRWFAKVRREYNADTGGRTSFTIDGYRCAFGDVAGRYSCKKGKRVGTGRAIED